MNSKHATTNTYTTKLATPTVPTNGNLLLKYGNPRPLREVFRIGPLQSEYHAKEVEEALHSLLAPQRVRGEWFDLDQIALIVVHEWVSEKELPFLTYEKQPRISTVLTKASNTPAEIDSDPPPWD